MINKQRPEFRLRIRWIRSGRLSKLERKITLSSTRLPFDRSLDFELSPGFSRTDKKEGNVCSRKRFSRILSFLYCSPVIRAPRPSGSNFPVSGIPKNRATRLIPPRWNGSARRRSSRFSLVSPERPVDPLIGKRGHC